MRVQYLSLFRPAGVVILALGVPPWIAAADFIRGDANGDGKVSFADANYILSYFYQDGARPVCYDAADANDDGRVDISDPIGTLRYLFLDGKALPAPNGAPGEDPTPDSLGCAWRF